MSRERITINSEGRECRFQIQAIVECTKCGKATELEADTEAWTQGDDGRWVHSEYGPAQGVCCGVLYVGSFEGMRAYRLR